MIQEVIVTTRAADGRAHIAPMGIHEEGDRVVIKPFRPSATLDNLLAARCAVVNCTDDVRVYAGCLSGRRDWPTRPATRVQGRVLEGALAHRELQVLRVDDDATRPEVHLEEVHAENHAPFRGFNRAQAAVLELAILVSRLERLPRDKVEREIEYLAIAVDKTAGERERQAWDWLMERVERHRAGAASPA